MIKINVNDDKLIDELNLVLKLFYSEDDLEKLDHSFFVSQDVVDDKIHTEIRSTLNDNVYVEDCNIVDKKFPERYKKRSAKILLFNLLQEYFPNKKLPWGSLTGIRPTKLYYELIKE